MAEETGTQGQTGQATPEPGALDPQSTSLPASGAASASQQQAQPDYAAQFAALHQTNERYKQQLEGSAAEARRLKAENEEIRRAQQELQTRFTSMAHALAGGTPANQSRPATAADALQRFVSGDDNAANDYFDNQTRNLVNEQLMAALGVLQRQQLPYQVHPELSDASNAIRADVFTAYEQLSQDPNMRLLYPQDPNMVAPMAGPDGVQKNYDLRLLDRAALMAKSKLQAATAATAERVRQGAGDVLSAGGSGPTGTDIAPTEFFSPRELEQFLDPVVLKGLPKEWGRDAKSIAKHLVDGMSAAEKARRLRERQQRTGAV